MYEEFTSISNHICNGLLSIGEDGFETRRMASLCMLFGRYQDPVRKFSQLSDHSYTKNKNSMADSLARSTKKQMSFVVHMDAELPYEENILNQEVAFDVNCEKKNESFFIDITLMEY